MKEKDNPAYEILQQSVKHKKTMVFLSLETISIMSTKKIQVDVINFKQYFYAKENFQQSVYFLICGYC